MIVILVIILIIIPIVIPIGAFVVNLKSGRNDRDSKTSIDKKNL